MDASAECVAARCPSALAGCSVQSRAFQYIEAIEIRTVRQPAIGSSDKSLAYSDNQQTSVPLPSHVAVLVRSIWSLTCVPKGTTSLLRKATAHVRSPVSPAHVANSVLFH